MSTKEDTYVNWILALIVAAILIFTIGVAVQEQLACNTIGGQTVRGAGYPILVCVEPKR
jgi:hypothetical protein